MKLGVSPTQWRLLNILSVNQYNKDQNFQLGPSNVQKETKWFEVSSNEGLVTPCLAVYEERISSNLARMVSIVSSPEQLCPHVKTHKSADILKLLVNCGIAKFKCATISELVMVCEAGGAEFALLAMQPTGPGIQQFVDVVMRFRAITLAAIVDNQESLRELKNAAKQQDARFELLLDINNGMDRTGIRCGDDAFNLYCAINDGTDQVKPGGLHVYDGHIHDHSLEQRTTRVEAAMEPVLSLRRDLIAAGQDVPRMLTGGTPSFPIHARHADRTCCPGTPVLWDAGYADNFRDLPFLPAATLLARVVSVVGESRYCLDLGYKSIAAEMSGQRAQYLNVNVDEECSQSEEHLVIRVDDENLKVGQLVYVLPWHICPTVAKHPQMLVIKNHEVVDRWPVTARDRV